MIFQKTKGIDLAFRHVKVFSMAIILAVVIVCALVTFKSYDMVSRMQQKVYVLANGKALEAYAAERKDNVPVEARDHIKTFHQLFFTLFPDDKAIKNNLTKSLYLADVSVKREYDNLTESNYYSNIITANISQTIEVDSVSLDLEQMPYYFRCYARQQIIRSTSTATRSLITEGYLSNVARSDNNSHGFLIERWKIIDNRDIQVEKR